MSFQQSEGTILEDKPSLIVDQLAKPKVNIPLDITTELSQYQKFFITKGQDFFRIICCCEDLIPEYNIYGEMPDGDKKLLFTCTQHFILCNCCGCSDFCPEYCQGCGIFCLCCGYLSTDIILFQMDYKRNNRCFYTQGISLPKGCYICKCISNCCCCNFCSCLSSTLDLKENTNPKVPSLGERKGYTKVRDCCYEGCNFNQCCDLAATYTSQEGNKGPTVRSPCICCCGVCRSCNCCKCCNLDAEIDIEDSQGVKKGNILIYGGCCSSKVESKCCYLPRSYFDINMPPDFTSEEKFQVIADLIHFDLKYGIV
jgi:hypothetical protein